jgi:hypothetical protein
VSGPARRRGHTSGASARRAAPLATRLRTLVDARFLDRLVRGRGWIALVAVGLIGIVFLQVSLLNLNAGISRAVTAAETLERQNATLREDISELDTGDRLANGAAKLGLIMPSAGEVRFLDARQADGRRAAAAIREPKPVAGAVALLPAAATQTSQGAGPSGGAVGAAAAGTGTGAPTGAGATATGTTATPAADAAAATGSPAGAATATGSAAPAAATGAAAGTQAAGSGSGSATGTTAPSAGSSTPTAAQAATTGGAGGGTAAGGPLAQSTATATTTGAG